MTLITTVSDSQKEILQNISRLHLNGEHFQADLTYGKGGFWSGWNEPEDPTPEIRVDLDPRGGASLQPNVIADISCLPFPDNTLKSCVVDLPFIHAHGKQSIIGNRFSSYPSQKALDNIHHDTARELARVTAPGGLVVWKCQDIIESSKQVWNHIKIYHHMTIPYDFHAEDLFILFRTRNALIGWNQRKQQHARRTHSYFWVFRKS